MMDFEDAAQRLARDQSKIRGRRTVVVSAKAKREAEYRKKQQERLRQERLQKQKHEDYMKQYTTACDRSLGVKPLSNISVAASSSSSSSGLLLQPTSIYGDGDKIALPPSVLEFLTQSSAGNDEGMSSSPWMFRIGILNPNYSFPESVLLQMLKPQEEDDGHDDDDEDDTMHDSDNEDDSNGPASTEAYLDELAHKYIAYTHGTVVEFTQEEGHVGLPEPIAAALLDPKRRLPENANFSVPATRTQDPSGMDTTGEHEDDIDEEKTPGHIAWGAFDVPDMPVEITMVRLPRGKGCTLTPTIEAIRNGFFNLQDIKLVLEQSLVRTRATLTLGDIAHTWHRGVKFDLQVSKVIPETFNAVTSINTDIEVEFGQVENAHSYETNAKPQMSAKPETSENTWSGGRTLSSSPTPKTAQPPTASAISSVNLSPEPPQDQKDGICTVQIRSDGVSPGRRRFDVQAGTLQDLFAFASFVSGQDPTTFRLVTRFPRNVYELGSHNETTTLLDAGIKPGQELFMVERF